MNNFESPYIGTLERKSEAGEKAGVFHLSFTWLLLLACLVGSCFLPAEILSASMLFMVVFFLADPYIRQRRLLFPGEKFFIVILLAGALGAAGKIPYDIAKDLWYVGNPALTLLFGYLISKKRLDLRSVLRAFVLAAVMVSVVHVVKFILNPSYLNESLIDIRGQVSGGYLMIALGFGIVFGDLRFGLNLLPTKWTSWLVMVLCLISITLSFSRTLWLMVMTLVLVALIINNFRAAFRIAIVAGVFIVVGIVSNEVYTVETETNPDITLIGKIMYTMKELQISDYEDIIEINSNWRGFESYLALRTYESGSLADYLFGKGLGTNVELGLTMTLMDEEFDRIPVLHNGYLYLLVKTGAIGLLAYLLYLFQTFRIGTAFSGRLDPESRMSGYLLIALTLIMLETTLVIAGMFNKSGLYASILLMGILMGYAEEILITEMVISKVTLKGDKQSTPREVEI